MAYIGEFEQMILFAVLRLGEDAYGVTIGEEIEHRTGRSISAGAIYTALGRLERRGLVESTIGEPGPHRQGRRRKYYRVQPLGASELQDSVSRLQRMSTGLLAELSRLAEKAESEEG